MNDEARVPPHVNESPVTSSTPMTLGMSSLYKLLEEFIALREKNQRQHLLFESSLNKLRDTLVERFNAFAGETQRAFQNLRGELTGEKRLALNVLSELLEIGLELEHIVEHVPEIPEEHEALRGWVESVMVQSRRIQDALRRHGIFPYDAVIGSPYNPALHERVGSKRMEGMDALRVAEQKEHGYASKHHDFVLRRPKVIVSE